MDWGRLLLVLAFWAFYGWQFWMGIARGRVLARYGWVERSRNPFSYWVMMPIYAFGTVFLPLMAIAIVVLSK